MTTETEQQLANRILQEQGYVVMASYDTLRVGQIRQLFTHHSFGSPEIGKVVVIAPATEKEFFDQEVRFGYGDGIPAPGGNGHNFYRVVAE